MRVTSRDTPIGRTTWIGLTVSAAANLAALQARSADIPLRETAEIALRRLADHLRELGWGISTTDIDVPDLFGPDVDERWRAVRDGIHGYVAAYAASPEVLTELWSHPSSESGRVLQLSGPGEDPQVSVACAVRSDEVPGRHRCRDWSPNSVLSVRRSRHCTRCPPGTLPRSHFPGLRCRS